MASASPAVSVGSLLPTGRQGSPRGLFARPFSGYPQVPEARLFLGPITRLPSGVQIHAQVIFVDGQGEPLEVVRPPHWSTDAPWMLDIAVQEDGMSAVIKVKGAWVEAHVAVCGAAGALRDLNATGTVKVLADGAVVVSIR